MTTKCCYMCSWIGFGTEKKKGIVRIAGKISAAFVDCMVVSVPELISRFEGWYVDCLCFGEIYNGGFK